MKDLIWSEFSSPYPKHTPVQYHCRISTFLSFQSLVIVESAHTARICRIPCELWCEPIHERIWKRRDRLVHTNTHLKTHRLAVISALCGRWGAQESQWQAQDVPDCQGRAHWHWRTHTHTHTLRLKRSSNESAQLWIIPSGQIYVFRDMQVAVEDGAKASEWSLDILTNPFKLVVSCTFATFASSQNWLFHICELSC